MKKYIYGTVLVAVVVGGLIFFVRPPETGDRILPTTLAITFRFPEGYEFTESAPFVLTWRVETPKGILSVPVIDKKFNPLISPYKLVFTPAPGSRAVVLNARLYYCHKASRMCFQDDYETHVPLESETLLKTRFQKGETGFLNSVTPWVWEIAPKAGNG